MTDGPAPSALAQARLLRTSARRYLEQADPALATATWSIAEPYFDRAVQDLERFRLDGPSPGGRIIQVRDSRLPGQVLFRLDLHPLRPAVSPILHYHAYPDVHRHIILEDEQAQQ